MDDQKPTETAIIAEPESPKYTLNKIDKAKIIRHALIVGFAAIFTYLVQEVLPTLNLGEWGPVITAGAAVALHAYIRWSEGQKES